MAWAHLKPSVLVELDLPNVAVTGLGVKLAVHCEMGKRILGDKAC